LAAKPDYQFFWNGSPYQGSGTKSKETRDREAAAREAFELMGWRLLLDAALREQWYIGGMESLWKSEFEDFVFLTSLKNSRV